MKRNKKEMFLALADTQQNPNSKQCRHRKWPVEIKTLCYTQLYGRGVFIGCVCVFVPNQLWYCSIKYNQFRNFKCSSHVFIAAVIVAVVSAAVLAVGYYAVLYCTASNATRHGVVCLYVLYVVFFRFLIYSVLCVLFSLHFVFLYFLNSGRKCLPFLIHYTHENEANIRIKCVRVCCFFLNFFSLSLCTKRLVLCFLCCIHLYFVHV